MVRHFLRRHRVLLKLSKHFFKTFCTIQHFSRYHWVKKKFGWLITFFHDFTAVASSALAIPSWAWWTSVMWAIRCFLWSNLSSQRVHSKRMTFPWIFFRWYFRSILDAYLLSHMSQANFFTPSCTTWKNPSMLFYWVWKGKKSKLSKRSQSLP